MLNTIRNVIAILIIGAVFTFATLGLTAPAPVPTSPPSLPPPQAPGLSDVQLDQIESQAKLTLCSVQSERQARQVQQLQAENQRLKAELAETVK